MQDGQRIENLEEEIAERDSVLREIMVNAPLPEYKEDCRWSL